MAGYYAKEYDKNCLDCGANLRSLEDILNHNCTTKDKE